MLQFDRRRPLPSRLRFALQPPLMGGCLTLVLSAPSLAADLPAQFQAGFMRQPPGQAAEAGALALQTLAAQTPLTAGRYRVALLVNLTPVEEREIEFHEATQGTGLQACLTSELLRTLNLREQALETPLPDDDRCVDLPALIPQASVDFDPSQLRLSLSIPQIALRQDRSGNVPQERWDTGINAAFVNYQASAQHSTRRDGRNSSSQDLYLSSGLNLGPWRLRSQQALRENEEGLRRWTRTDTYAQRDLPGLYANLTLGETFTSGEVFRTFAFSGARLASDQGMLSDTMRQYAPVIRGVAQSRAKVEVLRSGFAIYSTYVAPGPYEIDDLSVGSGNGELEVVVTESDGQVSRFIQPYSSLGSLLREGVWHYTATAGNYNGAKHLDNPRFWQGTLARGGAWNTTLYGGVLASDHYRATALGMARDFGELGALSLDATQANTDLGSTLGRVQGQSYSLRYGKSFQTRTSLRFAGYRYSTEGYRDFDESVQQRYADARFAGSRRSRVEASMYQNLGRSSSLSLTLSQEDYWRSDYQRRQYQLQYNTRVDKLAINLFASQSLSARNTNSRLFGVSLSLPLDFGRRPHTASFSLQHSDGKHSERASLQGGLLDDRLSYHASLASDQNNRQSGAVALAYQGSQGSFGVGYSEANDQRSLSLNASGALLVHADGIALGSYLGENPALVHVPNVANVGVQNASSARTDEQGYLLVSHLNPYRINSLVLDTDQLSPEVVIDNASQQVVPRRGAVIKARFDARKVVRMVLTLQQPDGRPLPFGAQVSDTHGQALGVVGQAGQTLLATTEPGQQQLQVHWGDIEIQKCHVTLDARAMPVSDGYRMQTIDCLPHSADDTDPASANAPQGHTS
ncbi:fimbria/pilus outer membrane usher protein [Pseudomonas sp. M2]|uniref:fimbria/pilus outer membrane usher protein n=1 Tax=Pseudomonas sp. M2 TaxID=228756 RepID=UPI000E6ADCD7|nr:fimbria/pilus outer membrane usher protein [Pseudomonas sp. M2]MBG6124074.1 outer membrane usher protein [Pseudomonas sp. M2]HDS1747923.1 fimbrial biogenesis outer membrane usher protein [Pseudomonas putida]